MTKNIIQEYHWCIWFQFK